MQHRETFANHLLIRRGLVFAAEGGAHQAREAVCVLDLQLAKLGYVLSSALHQRLTTLADAELRELGRWLCYALDTHKHAEVPQAQREQAYEPVFRSFPVRIPEDTFALWRRRVIALVYGDVAQPCLTCGQRGGLHLLQPCLHVICERCFDGSSYAACPVCLQQVDRESPFFTPSAEERRALPNEPVTYVRIDLVDDLDAAAKRLFQSLTARQQPLSPDDRTTLELVLDTYGDRVLDWMPERFALRENAASVLGHLLRHAADPRVLEIAALHLKTATDVLRLIASLSGADATLLPSEGWRAVAPTQPIERWRGLARSNVERVRAQWPRQRVWVHQRTLRWKMTRLPRPLRRRLLALLDAMPFEALADDMLRHRSAWVWVGQFLHPHEHHERFPNVARVFQIVRGRDPHGTPAPAHRTYYARIEHALANGDLDTALTALAQRPGELGRRLDQVLRLARTPEQLSRAQQLFEQASPRLSTPLLLALAGHLPTRTAPVEARVFFPKASVSLGPSRPDTRPPWPQERIAWAEAIVHEQLLGRFAARPHFAQAIVDRGLATITAPFTERAASPSAVALPRGSRLRLPDGEVMRMFLHWCQPKGGRATDVDLSVAFFDAAWNYRGVCSYYQLTLAHEGVTLATSSGDFTSARHPKGASEYIDLQLEQARTAGFRYAMMVVNAYSGLPFSALERAFAGFMLRNDTNAAYFDPRTVKLRFSLSGEHGVFAPVLLDLQTRELCWLDVYSKGGISMNNVARSQSTLARLGRTLLGYFASGARISMLQLAIWHAAARCPEVLVREGDRLTRFERRAGESPRAFAVRILHNDDHEGLTAAAFEPPAPVLAALVHGDLELPASSESYVLFPELIHGTMQASDWIV